MNIQIVTCPACLNKYNATVVRADGLGLNSETTQLQCPHCKYWFSEDELNEFQDILKRNKNA